MSCGAIRDRLVAGEATSVDRAHLERCAACSAFGERLGATRRVLAEPGPGFAPDAAFAARVVGRLPGGPSGALGRAALDLLPAALALTLVLAGWCLVATPAPDTLLEAESPTEDVVAWALESSGEGG